MNLDDENYRIPRVKEDYLNITGNSEKVKLEGDERILYDRLFGEIDRDFKVRQQVKECLSELVDHGFTEDERFADCIKLAKTAVDEELTSAEKGEFHVINAVGDVEVICRYREGGEWKMIASVERDLIEDVYKSKRTLTFSVSGNTTISSGTTTTTGNSSLSGQSIFFKNVISR